MGWLEEASQELYDLADSNPPGSGILAGNLYQFASRLNPKRAAALTRLDTGVADIRYWDMGHYSVYFRIDGNNAYTVLHIGKIGPGSRARSNIIAINRA